MAYSYVPMGGFYAGQIYSDTPAYNQVDVYATTLTSGVTYYLDLAGSSGAGLYDPQNQLVAYFGAQGQSYTPSFGGTYTLAINDSQGYQVSGGWARVSLQDATSNVTTNPFMTAYTGPVSYLTSEFIIPTTHALTIRPSVGNAFVNILGVGSARPTVAGIDVAAVGGNNVLDSYANSSFLVGGSGIDQFYEDARGLAQNSWTTVVNFHAGDNFTAWGVNAGDFTLQVIGDTQGAPGSTGLTGVLVPNSGGAAVGFTLAGFHMADYVSGRLSLSFSQTQSVGTTPGLSYAGLHCNW